MITVLSIAGPPPQALVMAPAIREWARCANRVRSVVCVTAQHCERFAPVLELFESVPDHDLDLDLLRPGQSPCQWAEAEVLLRNPHARQHMTTRNNPCGDGQAARRIGFLLLASKAVSAAVATSRTAGSSRRLTSFPISRGGGFSSVA